MTVSNSLTGTTADARGRILVTAYELFSRIGILAVGVDRVIAESGVAKMTLYRHFGSEDELVLEFVRRREQRWTQEWLKARSSGTPTTRPSGFWPSSTSSTGGQTGRLRGLLVHPIMAAGEGDREAARRAQAIGKLLLASEREPAAT